MIAFFNNKGGVGKTSLVYHLAWMYAEMGLKVVAADLDPQANLSAMFVDEERLEVLWPEDEHGETIFGVVRPILRGTGDIRPPHVENVADNVSLLVGDLGLSGFEDKLSYAWPTCLDGDEASFRVMSAFYRAMDAAAEQVEADLVLIDIGPNLGAINRAAIISAENIVIPLTPDLFSLQGLKNLGPTLHRWRDEWNERRKKTPDPDLKLPGAEMTPAGYILLQHGVRLDRPVKAYERWMARIPAVYRESVLYEEAADAPGSFSNDPHCIFTLKHYRSLMPLAMEARKPMFLLKPADGAIGAHMAAVQSCYEDFRSMAGAIAGQCGVPL